MSAQPLLCYITDRTQFPGDEPARRQQLLAKISEAAQCGVDYIQLREKDLHTRALEELASTAMSILHSVRLRTENRERRTILPGTALLINARTDVALAVDADGVHLPANDISAADARNISCGADTPVRKGVSAPVTISVSCHEPLEVQQAKIAGADLAVFAPVFEKKNVPEARPAGLDALREACRFDIPILALGGIHLGNAKSCLEAGAAGIAAIRLFQENDIADVVSRLLG